MTRYRFSPIQNKEELIQALTYVTVQASKLSETIIGIILPVTSATVFSHDPDEYRILSEILSGLGKEYDRVNGLRVVLHEPIKIQSHMITHLRVRPPDPNRPQVGCCDFNVQNYEIFKREQLKSHAQNLRLIERPEYEMIEFFSPEFDILAYVVSA